VYNYWEGQSFGTPQEKFVGTRSPTLETYIFNCYITYRLHANYVVVGLSKHVHKTIFSHLSESTDHINPLDLHFLLSQEII